MTALAALVVLGFFGLGFWAGRLYQLLKSIEA